MLTGALSCPWPALEVLNPRSAAPPPLASPLARPSRAVLAARRGGTALPEHPSPPPRRLRRASASLPAEKLCAQLGRAPRGAGSRSAHGCGSESGAAPPAQPRVPAASSYLQPAPLPAAPRSSSSSSSSSSSAPRWLQRCCAEPARAEAAPGPGGSAGPPAAPALPHPPNSGEREPPPRPGRGQGAAPGGDPPPELLLPPPALAPSEGTRLPARCPPASPPGSTCHHGPAAGSPRARPCCGR